MGGNKVRLRLKKSISGVRSCHLLEMENLAFKERICWAISVACTSGHLSYEDTKVCVLSASGLARDGGSLTAVYDVEKLHAMGLISDATSEVNHHHGRLVRTSSTSFHLRPASTAYCVASSCSVIVYTRYAFVIGENRETARVHNKTNEWETTAPAGTHPTTVSLAGRRRRAAAGFGTRVLSQKLKGVRCSLRSLSLRVVSPRRIIFDQFDSPKSSSNPG